jgi:hypothetical protein
MRPLEGFKVFHKTGSCGKLDHNFKISVEQILRTIIPDDVAKFQPNRIQESAPQSFYVETRIPPLELHVASRRETIIYLGFN